MLGHIDKATVVNRYLQTNRGFVMNRDQVKGSIKDATGKVQEKAGKLTGSTGQQVKGLAKQAEGKAQKGVGDAKHATKNSDRK